MRIALAVFLSLVVICAAFFAVYAISRGVAEKSGDMQSGRIRMGATNNISINRGDVYMLTLPEGLDAADVTFTTSDEKIVRVDSAGRIDALSEGRAKVTAASDSFSVACEFRVDKAKSNQGVSELTTAYIANLDRIEENSKNGTDDLYRLIVNRRTNTVTAYTYDADKNYTIPVRAMVCSCGAGGADITPVGEYASLSKRTWAMLYGDATHPYLYGQYVTEFNGEYLFHSVPYEERSKSTLETEEFNKLGANASQGCVRMMTSDCRWIYDNCPLNTPVSVIDADASADPLGTPPTVKLNYQNGWDPTDPNQDNPYLGKRPRILNIDDVNLKQGDDFDPMDGVIARDICGNRITDRVKITGNVITDKPGIYYLNYTVTDDFRLTKTVTRTVVVK